MNMSVWSTWVEIHVCLQQKTVNEQQGIRSTWVEIHVCLQRCKMKKNMMKDLHE